MRHLAVGEVWANIGSWHRIVSTGAGVQRWLRIFTLTCHDRAIKLVLLVTLSAHMCQIRRACLRLRHSRAPEFRPRRAAALWRAEPRKACPASIVGYVAQRARAGEVSRGARYG